MLNIRDTVAAFSVTLALAATGATMRKTAEPQFEMPQVTLGTDETNRRINALFADVMKECLTTGNIKKRSYFELKREIMGENASKVGAKCAHPRTISEHVFKLKTDDGVTHITKDGKKFDPIDERSF